MAEMPKVERNIMFALRNNDDFAAECMRNPGLIEHVWVPAG